MIFFEFYLANIEKWVIFAEKLNPVTHFKGFFSLLRRERELIGREIDLFGIQRECGFQSHNL